MSMSNFFEMACIVQLFFAITILLWIIFFFIIISLFYSKISINTAAINVETTTHDKSKVFFAYFIVILAIISTILSTIFYFIHKENNDLKNINFDSWAKSWDVKIIKLDETFDDAKLVSINWKISKQYSDTSKYYLESDGGKDIKLLNIKQQVSEKQNQAYLTGWLQYKDKKSDFEFFMSPNGKTFTGKVYDKKNKELQEFWYATKKQ